MSTKLIKVKHGGNLYQAAQCYNIPIEQWLDLSTGINPRPWQPVEIPQHIWQRLPEEDDNLLAVAKDYYQTQSLLAVAGSQEAIQRLPTLRAKGKVGIVSPCYAEHEYCWRKAGHEVIPIAFDDVELYLSQLDVLIVINPNNPDTRLIAPDMLRQWHQVLQARQGWLVVDEAFMDATPDFSLLNQAIPDGMIILRSIGKFFGLAGIRLGFVAANKAVLKPLSEQLNPWHISHPARWVGALALADTQWHEDTRYYLPRQREILQACLAQAGFDASFATAHFVFIKHPNSALLQHQLAEQGIWVRLFPQLEALRFGLAEDITRLSNCLQK
ncbi:MAG TPA: threonine-phosphate decarboxylase [Thiothrix sp.]|nr:threonine-phosphate decarboxylase [Thiothrix sp.]